MPVGFAQPAENAELIEKTSASNLAAIERIAREAGVPFEGAHRTDDYPAHAILEVAGKKGCDLIVMGTQGEGGLSGMLVGSVTQKVLAKSKIPVMVVR